MLTSVGVLADADSTLMLILVALVSFLVQVIPKPAAGAYPLNVQVTDSVGDLERLTSVASIYVRAGAETPTASPSSTP